MTLRLRAALFAGLVAAAAAMLAMQAWRGLPLQTNILAMLPPTERDAAAERAVAKLGADLGRRVAFLVSHRDEDQARAAADRFAAELRAAGGFRSVTGRLPALDPGLLLSLYGAARFGLLSEPDRALLSHPGFEPRTGLLRQLSLPFAPPSLLPLAKDPFGFFGRWLTVLEPPSSNLRLEDGYLTARDRDRVRVLVTAEADGDPYDQAVQSRIVAAWERAAAALGPAAEPWRTGMIFFAAEARGAAMADMDRIGAGSLIGITVLMLLAFRSLQPMLLGLASVAVGIVLAALGVALIDGEIHLITLAFGASLIGEAIDYSILVFAAHHAAGAQWNVRDGFAKLRPGLTVAVATSLLAYALLALLPFPGVAQIARFALVGLAGAYLSVMLLLPAFLSQPSRRDPLAATRWTGRLSARWRGLLARRGAVLALPVVLLAACVPGWLSLTANDDVRTLAPRSDSLSRQDRDIRRVTGLDAGGRFFLIRGAGEQEVLARETALVKRLRALEAGGALMAHQAVSDFVPPGAQQESDRALMGERIFNDPAPLRAAMAEAGFSAQAADDLARDFARGAPPVAVRDWLASPLSTPYRHLWQPAGPDTPASAVTLFGEVDPGRIAHAADGLEGVMLIDKAGSASALLGWFRARAVPALFVAALAVLLVLSVRYGARAALRVMIPVAMGEALSVAVFGYSGTPVTLFAAAGWLLSLGIGVNYAIFLREGMQRPGATVLAVLLSGATTLLGFGLLSLSSVAALHQFGLALLTTIAVSVALAPLALEP